MTKQEVIDYMNAQYVAPITQVQTLKNVHNKILDFITESTVDEVIPDWTALLEFMTDGTLDGKYCVYPDENGKKRIFETKTDNNIGNAPPVDPDLTENAYWEEISQSGGSAIKEWTAGIYGTGLVIVFHNHSEDGPGLYILLEATRPFASTNIETEITAGSWAAISTSLFKGYFTSLANLQAAHPTSYGGAYAIVDEAGSGDDELAKIYIWDEEEEDWILGTGSTVVAASQAEAETAADAVEGNRNNLTSFTARSWRWAMNALAAVAFTITGAWVFSKLRFRNAADTFTSILENANTAARTYTFQDRDDTIAGLKDLGKVYTTSGAGAVSDADLSLGSITFGTDNTSIIQGLLDLASSANAITIIWDGKYSVTGLKIKGNTKILALPGCGAILRNHSSDWLIKNYNRIGNGLTAYSSIVDENIEIHGGIWNHNGYNVGANGSDLIDATYGHATNGSAQYRTLANSGVAGDFLDAFGFYGVRHLILKDLTIFGPRNFAIGMRVCEDWTFENVLVDFGSVSTRDPFYYDGIHMYGPCRYGNFNNPRFSKVKDDNIAFAANGSNPSLTFGPITDVKINNITLADSAYGLSFRSESNAIDRVTINGVRGDTKNYAFVFGTVVSGPGAIGVINISDVQVAVTSSPDLSAVTYGTYMYINCKVDVLNISKWARTDFSQNYSLIKTGADANVGILNLDCPTYYTSNTTHTKDIIEIAGGTINRLNIINAELFATSTELAIAVVKVTAGTLSVLQFKGVTSVQAIRYLLNHTGGTVTTVVAGTVRHGGSTAGASFTTTGTVTVLIMGDYRGLDMLSGTFTNIQGCGIVFYDVLSPAQITSNQNNYNPTGIKVSKTIRLSTDASRDITGLNAGGSHFDKREIAIMNVGSFDLVLKGESASSTAGYRFAGADFTLAAGQACRLIYDGTSSRWRKLY